MCSNKIWSNEFQKPQVDRIYKQNRVFFFYVGLNELQKIHEKPAGFLMDCLQLYCAFCFACFFFASPSDCQDEVLVQLLRTWGIDVDNWVPVENPAKAKAAKAPTASPPAVPKAETVPPQLPAAAAPAAPPQESLPAAPAAPPQAKAVPAAPAAPPQAAMPVKVEPLPPFQKAAAPMPKQHPEKNLLELHVTRMHLQEMNLGVMMMIFSL